MKSVNVAELKNRLSHYLRLVRKGEALLVRDRNEVIARIEPAGTSEPAADDEEWIATLERAGTIRRGRGTMDPRLFKARPRARASIVDAVLRERDEGR